MSTSRAADATDSDVDSDAADDPTHSVHVSFIGGGVVMVSVPTQDGHYSTMFYAQVDAEEGDVAEGDSDEGGADLDDDELFPVGALRVMPDSDEEEPQTMVIHPPESPSGDPD